MIKQVKLRDVKIGTLIKRKLSSDNVFIRNHFNRKNDFYSASISCNDFFDMNREVFLNPNTLVFIDFDF
jgi:hypothetical protein